MVRITQTGLSRLAGVTAFLLLTACNGKGTLSESGSCVPARPQALSSHLSQAVPSHIPAAVKDFSDQGRLSDETVLPVTISLPLRNEAELDQQLAAVYQPGNPRFHQFVGPAEFRSRFAPSPEDIAKVQSFLVEQGLQGVVVNENGYLIQALGTAKALNQAFRTELRQYRKRTGEAVFAPAYEPRMPSGLSIQSVHGLHNVSHLKSYAHARPLGQVTSSASTSLGMGLSPSDIHGAYNLPSSVTGAGQTLAVVELDGYNPADIATYETSFGLPKVPLTNIFVDGANGSAGAGAGEVTLDIELMVAIAPGASKILVYEAPNNSLALLDLYSRIANDNLAAQISTSWGLPEADESTAFLQAENGILKQMALQGQSFFAASGDSGAYDNGSALGVDDPASQPFVVAVGGTHLNSNGPSYLSETTWDSGSPSGGAGGGGVSTVWVQPGWQNGFSSASNLASSNMRNVPDVSLNADPSVGYAIFVGGRWMVYGGTSCAAPLWAGFTALVNQQRQANGLGPLGFPNPYLYVIGKGSRYHSDFRDILDGSTNLHYPAVPGYDDATGLGSFNGLNLFQDLSTDPAFPASALTC